MTNTIADYASHVQAITRHRAVMAIKCGSDWTPSERAWFARGDTMGAPRDLAMRILRSLAQGTLHA